MRPRPSPTRALVCAPPQETEAKALAVLDGIVERAQMAAKRRWLAGEEFVGDPSYTTAWRSTAIR